MTEESSRGSLRDTHDRGDRNDARSQESQEFVRKHSHINEVAYVNHYDFVSVLPVPCHVTVIAVLTRDVES